MKKYLILADGTIYEGTAIGIAGESVGEVVFTTGMGGYMDTLCDSANYGLIVVQTYPMIGNAGAIVKNKEASPKLSGYVVRELCEKGSNYAMESNLNDYLIAHKVIGIADVDTRSLTRKIREYGVINGMICDDKNDLEQKLQRIKTYKVQNALQESVPSQQITMGEGEKTVVVVQYGNSNAIECELAKRGFKVVTMPFSATSKQILEHAPSGIVLTGGAGDPNDCTQEINELQQLNKAKIPTLGIGLGHQLLALSTGARVIKLKHGHRGCNQPVKHNKSKRVYITAQNHGYVVDSESLKNATVSFMNINDLTCEGIEYQSIPAFSVQFSPEVSGGTQEVAYLFDDFAKLVRGEKNA